MKFEQFRRRSKERMLKNPNWHQERASRIGPVKVKPPKVIPTNPVKFDRVPQELWDKGGIAAAWEYYRSVAWSRRNGHCRIVKPPVPFSRFEAVQMAKCAALWKRMTTPNGIGRCIPEIMGLVAMAHARTKWSTVRIAKDLCVSTVTARLWGMGYVPLKRRYSAGSAREVDIEAIIKLTHLAGGGMYDAVRVYQRAVTPRQYSAWRAVVPIPPSYRGRNFEPLGLSSEFNEAHDIFFREIMGEGDFFGWWPQMERTAATLLRLEGLDPISCGMALSRLPTDFKSYYMPPVNEAHRKSNGPKAGGMVTDLVADLLKTNTYDHLDTICPDHANPARNQVGRERRWPVPSPVDQPVNGPKKPARMGLQMYHARYREMERIIAEAHAGQPMRLPAHMEPIPPPEPPRKIGRPRTVARPEPEPKPAPKPLTYEDSPWPIGEDGD